MVASACAYTPIDTPVSFDLSDIASIITALVSAIALVISFRSLQLSKRSVVTESISKNRINWISTVRKLILSFLAEYRGKCQIEKLVEIYTEIALYCNPKHDTYSRLISAMKKCILSRRYKSALYWDVLWEGQCVLDDTWVRMKHESGIKNSDEASVTRTLKQQSCRSKKPKWNAYIATSANHVHKKRKSRID